MAESNRKRQSTPKNTGKSTRGAGTSRKGGSGAKRGQGKSANTEQDMGFLRAEVVIICSFAVAVLLFLSNFRLCGVVGEALRRAQLGVFGMVGFLVPILLFVGTCFHMSNEGNIHAALKLGAAVAEGVDIDPVAVRTAGENAALNGVQDKLTVLVGDLSDKASGKYDIITANIVANAILSLAPAVPGLMAEGATFIASGIIDSRKDEVIAGLEKAGLAVVEVKEKRGWECIVCKKA